MKNNGQSGRFISLYHDLLNSPAYRVLSSKGKTLLIDLRVSYYGCNNGNISAAFSDLKHRGWKSPATLSKSLYELRSLGFIAVTRAGGLKQGTRVCSLYRFTDLPVLDIPKHGIQAVKATHDYKAYKTLSEAVQAVTDGCNKLKAEGIQKQSKKNRLYRKKHPPLQKMHWKLNFPVQKLNKGPVHRYKIRTLKWPVEIGRKPI